MSKEKRKKVREYIKTTGIKAGHVYKHAENGKLYRILGIGLESISLTPKVIYTEVNDIEWQDIYTEDLESLKDKLIINN